jgi:ABC-type spermidine/putrescine transport system permease subunit I
MKLYHTPSRLGKGSSAHFGHTIRKSSKEAVSVPYASSYIGVAIAVAALVGASVWWTYSKYKRKAK